MTRKFEVQLDEHEIYRYTWHVEANSYAEAIGKALLGDGEITLTNFVRSGDEERVVHAAFAVPPEKPATEELVEQPAPALAAAPHDDELLKPGDEVIEHARTDPPVGTVRGTYFDDYRDVLYIQVDYGTGTLQELPRESLARVGPMPWEVLRPIENPDDPEEVLGLEPDTDWL